MLNRRGGREHSLSYSVLGGNIQFFSVSAVDLVLFCIHYPLMKLTLSYNYFAKTVYQECMLFFFQELFGICWDGCVMNWGLQSASVVLIKPQSWTCIVSLGRSSMPFLILLALFAESVGSVWPCLFPVLLSFASSVTRQLVPFPNQSEFLFQVEESDSREATCPFAFLQSFCPRFTHNGHFQELVKSFVVGRKRAPEKVGTAPPPPSPTPVHYAAPGE